MGKEKSIHKQIANAIKAKGLQKLRWYCQLCQKQCRDENGFKCHQTSEGHKRQMMLFGVSPEKFLDNFSEQFQNDFVELMRRTHPNTRVHCNDVYREYIADRHHVHMNSTRWLTLTDFVKHLGREGICKVEETDKGFFIRLVVEDPFKGLQQGDAARRAAAEEALELRRQKELMAQVERAKAEAEALGEDGPAQATALERGDDDAPLKVALGTKRPAPTGGPAKVTGLGAFGEDEEEDGGGHGARQRRVGAAERIMEEEMRKKARLEAEARVAKGPVPGGEEKKAGVAGWVREGIVVKVMSKALKEHGYYKKKGEVVRVVGGVLAEIEMADSGDVIRVDERELETVVPNEGGKVVVVRGEREGQRGTLVGMDVKQFQAEIELGEERVWMEYEDFSKAAKKK